MSSSLVTADHPSASEGTLYLLPVPIAEGKLQFVPEQVQKLSCSLKFFFVENVRTARRYLKSIDPSIDIDVIQFSEINNHVKPDLDLLRKWLGEGQRVGVMSEAGCPGIADPGSELVAKAQEWNYRVVPLPGPASVFLALMGSGLNGQGFRFAGYLPVKEPLLSKAIKELEALSAQNRETQIFIETPYRNNQLIQDLLKHCKKSTRLCIAAHLTADNEFIRTQTIAAWKQAVPDLHKIPAIFLLLA